MANEPAKTIDLSLLQMLFRFTAGMLPVALVVTDRNGAILLVNLEAETLFGYPSEELIGAPIEQLLPERYRRDHPRHRNGFSTAAVSRRMGASRDLYGLRKDGSEFPIEIGLNPLETNMGPIVLSAVADVTERKKYESELKSLVTRLDESNRELEQFAYIASHDMQEPLRKVAACCQAVTEDCGDKLSAMGKEWIAHAMDGAIRMRQMISDLLELARIAAKGNLAQPTDAYRACQDAIFNLADAIQDKGAKIICGSLPKVMADPTQLVQLFQNLIGNGLKYCGNNLPLIEIRAEPFGKFWQFHVKDNGIGIAPAFHERIFQVFQRLHRQDAYPGTGIGLAICKKVVERFGGRLWVESQVGTGSDFIFTMPAVESRY